MPLEAERKTTYIQKTWQERFLILKSKLLLCFFIVLIVTNFFEEKLLQSTEALALLHYNSFYVVNQTAEMLFLEVTHSVFKPSRINCKCTKF